jgi:ketosteroid isomerase-like protein
VSQENVEIVRRSLEAFSRRDVETMRALNDPGLELDWSESKSWLAGIYRGFDEALRFYEGYYEAFEEIVFVADSFIDAGEFVVVPNVAHQRGRGGVEVSARSTLVFTVRDRKITRICLYQEHDHERALKAVGLEG